MTKFSEVFFCPAPWTNIHYQINSPSPCHLTRTNQLGMNIDEYQNSKWLANIKRDMVEGRIPDACAACRDKESQGLKSTRGSVWGYHNVGPEPNYEDQWFYNRFTADTPTIPYKVELRFSNLCNMKCRMCEETSSSAWAKEKKMHNLPCTVFTNPSEKLDLEKSDVIYISDDKIAGLKNHNNIRNLTNICITGGEPFLIKEYYDYLDFLIDSGLSENISLEIFTNSSVYNPLFIKRLYKFKKVNLIMSVDGVGKTAEYIRHGTDWSQVEKNIRMFNSLKHPIFPEVTITTSAYTLLDLVQLSKFLLELYNTNKTIVIKGYNVTSKHIQYHHAPKHLRNRMLEQINKSIEILNVPNYQVFYNELHNIKNNLLNLQDNLSDGSSFVDFTRQMDVIRNESFEEVFGLALEITK